jgi:phage gp29-like protein
MDIDASTIGAKASLEPANAGAMPDWTAARVKSAFRRANAGEMQEVADLCDTIRTEARIRGVLQTRTNALLGSRLSFEAPGETTKNEITSALEIDGEWWDIAPESALSKLFGWSLLLNIGLAEIVWERDELRSMKWRPTLVPKHPRNLRWDWEKRRWMLRVSVPSGSGSFHGEEEIEITPGDGRWLMLHPFGKSEPWASGLVWPLAIIYLAKAYANYDWERRNEARGRSALVGMTPDGALDADREKFAKDIQGLRTKLGIALPAGYDLKSVEFGVDDHESFDKKIQNADAAIAILLLGQNLTTEVRNAGSYAAGRAQERVRQDYLEGDAEVASTNFREQLLIPYARIRFEKPQMAPYPVWDTTPAENVAQAANIMSRAADALEKLLSRGIDVDVGEYARKFGIPLRSTNVNKTAAPKEKSNAGSE